MTAMTKKDQEIVKDYSKRDYRTVWQKPRAAFEDRLEGKIINKILPKDPGLFIDLGAGYGRLYPLYDMPGRTVFMVDYETQYLKLASEVYKAKKNIFYIAANAYHLPFRNEVFDAGISIRTFHHMNKPERFLEENSRVMKAGSRMLLEYSNKRNFWKLIRNPKKNFRKNHEEYNDLQFGTHPAFLKEMAAQKGFSVEDTMGTAFFPKFLNLKTSFLLPVLTPLEYVFDTLVGRTLAPMNFAILKKTGKKILPVSETTGIVNLLACPACKNKVEAVKDGMKCVSCGRFYPKVGDIFDFRYEAAS